MILILSSMRAYAIVTGDDPEPQPLDFDHDDNYDDWKANEAEAACKGAYASVRPHRHTYGNYGIRLQTWTRVIVNRCIGKIMARDLSLVASRLYRMAVTRPQSRVAVTLSPSFGADLLGCINHTREKEKKGKKVLYNSCCVRTRTKS